MGNSLIRMTASEMGNIWAGYMVDHMAACFLGLFQNWAADPVVKEVIGKAQNLGFSQLEKRRKLMEQEGIPYPRGFSMNADTHAEAPPLFSEKVTLHYLLVASRLGLGFYANVLGRTVREDIRSFVQETLTATGQLYSSVLQVMLEKGLYLRPPVLSLQEEPEFIRKSSFLNGFFGDKRPLSAMEAGGLYSNIELTWLLAALNTAFAQVSQDDAIKAQFISAKELAEEHTQAMGRLLQEDELHAPVSYVSEIGTSTAPTFSDRLMLCHAAGLIGSLIEAYGFALSHSTRKDVAVVYIKQIGEAGLLAERLSKALISREWLEKPPGALERQALS